MSKRSGLSRWEDLKRGFIDVGRYRYILHKIDMEPWRDKLCPVCNFGFGKEPTFYMDNFPIHNDCSFTEAYDKWMTKRYKETSEYDQYYYDAAYNAHVAAHGEE